MAMAPEKAGIGIRRHFTVEGSDPYDELVWERRDARITNFRDGSVAFEQREVEFPTSWSQNATNIVAQKYFRGPLGSPEREQSLRQVIDRVVETIAAWGRKDGYFVDADEADAFRAELKHLLAHQKAAFNSPVWFNIGVPGEPQQASACQPWDALVSTPEGLVPIGALVDEGAVGTKVFDGQGLTSVVAVKANGRKSVLRIHTTDGYTLDVTADHLVWVERPGQGGQNAMAGFEPAGRIGPGDRLEWHQTDSWGNGQISRRPAWPERETQAVAEAAVAGWIHAGGFVVDVGGKGVAGSEVTVSSDAEEQWFRQALRDALPNVQLRERVGVGGGAGDGGHGRRLRLEGTGQAAFVQRWGMARGAEAAVPSTLFTAALPVAAAYLRSLFQAEGWLSENGNAVGLAMASERVMRGVQSLLLRFGIYSRLRRVVERRAGGNDFWVLNVAVATDGRRFADEIGFVDPDRARELDAALSKTVSGVGTKGAAAGPVRLVEVDWVELRGEMPVYDIQTESGEYLSGNLRVHNCFILAVDDTMRSILNWYVEEGTIFKGGSGAGINLSTIRSSRESLKGGGAASGPVSFMRGADASAGTIKCLHAGTLIPTDHGLVPIRDVQVGWRVPTRSGERVVEAVHDNGVRPLVRVRTEFGGEVLCTPEHRFWVRGRDGEEWRRAGELRADDHLLVDLSSPFTGARQPLQPAAAGLPSGLPDELDEPFALWLGWAFGSGSVSTSGNAKLVSITIADGEEQSLVERYRSVVRAAFGTGVRFSTAPNAVRFSSGPIIDLLERNGLRPADAPDQARVPAVVHSSPAAVRGAFLSGLFEAVGHVASGAPTLTTASRGLALDVHRMLLSLGIPSTVGEFDDRLAAFGTRTVHSVRVVSEEGVRRFAKLVGFLSDRKAMALEAAVAYTDASPFEGKWYLPHVSADGPVEVRRLGVQRARALLERHPERIDDEPLARFAAGDALYVTATVEPAGEGPTFDLTVEDAHEYLVDNLWTHNSGGKTRRAAKMVILNADHPDVEDFIWCKAVEERKARVLRDAGFDMDLDGKDSHSTQYQNANNSVRVTDEFMQAVVDDREWHFRAVTTGDILKTVRARDLFRQISEAAWECADPGMQFDTTINRWHTASITGRINASNPCSEYMHLDNSACNLASLNLLKFLRPDGSFDVDGFKQAVEVVFTAQEILVGNADYPTEKIAATSRRFRQLGLGYANLGALLMALGMPYDSDDGRAWAASITALMTGHAYSTSARIASRMGPFAGYTDNAEPMNRVLRMHRDASRQIDSARVPGELLAGAQESWDAAVELSEWFGVRNSQSSVLAPTGTIGLMMDCDTTGIEPDLGLCKTKKLVGGGTMSIVNQTVPKALSRLGYTNEQVSDIVAYIDEHKSIVGAPHLKAEHLPVFACSMGDNVIHYLGHVKMMGAVQPFISGAISKTINTPEDTSIEEIEQLHIDAWKLGLKAVAIYRDNCKVAQPLSTTKKDALAAPAEKLVTQIVREPVRERLPRKRTSKTFSFRVADCHGYVTVGEYDDGRPGEIFLRVAKQGSTLAGIMDAFAISVSHGLQYGVPLKAFVDMYTNMRFEPAGMTDDPDLRFASSLVDYIFRRLAVEYLPLEDRMEIGILTIDERMQPTLPGVEESATPNSLGSDVYPDPAPPAVAVAPAAAPATAKPRVAGPTVAEPLAASDAPYCYQCGMVMQRAGACFVCSSCGTTSGCS